MFLWSFSVYKLYSSVKKYYKIVWNKLWYETIKWLVLKIFKASYYSTNLYIYYCLKLKLKDFKIKTRRLNIYFRLPLNCIFNFIFKRRLWLWYFDTIIPFQWQNNLLWPFYLIKLTELGQLNRVFSSCYNFIWIHWIYSDSWNSYCVVIWYVKWHAWPVY